MLFSRQNEFDAEIDLALKANAPADPKFIRALTKAFIATESSFNPRAIKYEPKINDASRGLMQILFRTAGDVGFKGRAEDLFGPATNVLYGQKYLLRQIKRYPGSLDDAISAYNGGHAMRLKTGGYFNQEYVNKIKKYLPYFQAVEAGDKAKAAEIETTLKKK